MKRSVSIPAIALLIVLGASAALAQWGPGPMPMPQPGVRGQGAIEIPAGDVKNLGILDINVTKGSMGPVGGFKFMEITPTGFRKNVVYSMKVISLDITEKTALVKAEGMWNNMPALLDVKAVDNGPTGDVITVTASPKYADIPSRTWEGTLVKGDIIVTNPQIQPMCVAKGFGTIVIGDPAKALGKFQFQVQKSGDRVMGSLNYAEMPLVAPTWGTPMPLPTRIYIPAVQKMTVDGTTAVFAGQGVYNGQKAMIEVAVADYFTPGPTPTPVTTPDKFAIKATPIDATSTLPAYEAGGPLRDGDIVVKCFTPTPPPQ